MDKKDLRIAFFGTPLFAVESLRAILDNGFKICVVISGPDKAAGRGYETRSPEVKLFAISRGIPVLQPPNLKSPEFIETLRSFNANLQVVIAFRMLPEKVWNMPELGTFNLHASYLPAYRGAAPINRAIMNGETESGITTFFLKHEIDTGNIILQEKIQILPGDNAGTLHDRMMKRGANLVIRSLELILEGKQVLFSQESGNFPKAPKIFTEDCGINWNNHAKHIHNLVRGLSPYPCAFTTFRGKKLKVYSTVMMDEPSVEPGKIEVRGKDLLLGHCGDRVLSLIEIQPEGKKKMSARDFINGLQN